MQRHRQLWIVLTAALFFVLLASGVRITAPTVTQQAGGLAFTPPGLEISAPVARAATTGQLITRVYTDKARYSPGASVTITAVLTNTTGASWTGTLALAISKLETSVYSATSASTTVANGASTTVNFTWTAPAGDFTGYYAGITAGVVDFNGTGIDVSSNSYKFPRYGYISDFPTTQNITATNAMINEMSRDYHINMYQFYDWMWRHDVLLKRTGGTVDSTWLDLFDRTLSWSTIQNDVTAVHNINGSAMAYVMGYAGRENYQSVAGISPTWGMFSDTAHASQLNVDFNNGKYLWLLNPANKDWQTFIINQYKDAVNTAGFDGLQIDQMGQRNNVYDYNGFALNIPSTFPVFLRAVKEGMVANNPAKSAFTFNIVDGTLNGWAANETGKYGAQEFNFSEIWYLSNSYGQLRNYIEQLRANSGNKATVLAGYMNYNQEVGPQYEAETATLTNTNTNTNHTGYTGTGFVEGFASVGDAITWSISFPETGDYSPSFRYANASGSSATRNLYVDGALVGQVSFASQANWDTWAVDAWIKTRLTAGTHTVKLAYDSGNTGAINVDHLTLGQFEENSIRLADAAMFASGATHIEIGDGNAMLPHEYYPNKSKSMRNSLKDSMRDYYGFATAYENLLFDTDVVPADQGGQWITSTSGQTLSGNATAGTVWQMIKRKSNYDIIHLINLYNNDDQWRNTGATPTTQTNMVLKYYPGPNATISGVYLASPDKDHGLSASLSYTSGSDSGGNYVQFTVPTLKYWDMVYVKRTVATPGSSQYEAESAIKTNTNSNTNHTGYTGSGFVENFSASGDGVSFTTNITTTDSYTLRFRYANGGTGTSWRNLYVDGQPAGALSFRNMYNWDIWDISEKVVTLSAGVHQIVLWYDPSNTGAVNLDNLVVLRQTSSAATSATSLWMNNWSNVVGIHMASKLSPADTGTFGPRLAELHFSSDWETNQLVDATAFMQDKTGGTIVKYDDAHQFNSEAWFESDGIMTTRYLNYGTTALPFEVTKQYAMVPNQPFVVVKYSVKNLTSGARVYNFLEQAHLNNKTKGSGSVGWQHGWWDSSRNALGTDMSQTGQYYMEMGALQTMDSRQVGNDADSNSANTTSGAWYQFDANSTLKNNGDLWAQDLSLGFQKAITISASSTITMSFYYALGSTQAAAESAADTARAQSGDYWFNQTATAYTNWLNAGTRITMTDIGLNTAYDRSLVINKQSQQPQYGSWPAATNPAYAYKVWVRDSAATAMGMDATGHLTEAEKYWNWMASVQSSDGTWHTNYSVWQANQWISFVEPEHDAIGLFLIGVYKHYQKVYATNPTAAATFLNGVWTQVTRSGDFIRSNVGSNGFSASDASIWEEGIEFNTFTQATYAEGLNAAKYMATAKSDTTRATNYLASAQTIKAAMLRSFTASPRGLYNDSNGYFNRAVNTDGTARTLIDASSNLFAVFGMLPMTDTRVLDHRIQVLSNLTHDNYGIARYQGDSFYYTSPYSPGGAGEAGAAEPVWPQMVMYMAMMEHWMGNDTTSLARLQWYASRTGRGYVTPGEAVDWTTGQPLISTSAEPVTGAWYQMAILNYLNQYDPRLPGF